MPAPYDLPSGNNVTTIQGLLTYGNSISSYFGFMIILGAFVIPFSIFTVKFGKLRAFAGASWSAFMCSIFISIIGIAPMESIAITFSMVVISLILLWKQ